MNGVSVDMILDMLIANNVTEIYLDVVGKMIPWSEERAQGGLSEDDVAAGMVSESQVRGFVKKMQSVRHPSGGIDRSLRGKCSALD